MKKHWRWGLAFAATAAVACGSDGDGGEGDADAGTDTVEDFDGFTGPDVGEDVADDTDPGEDTADDVIADTTEDVDPGEDVLEDAGSDATPDVAEDAVDDTTADVADTTDAGNDPDTSTDASEDVDDPDVVEPPAVDWCRLQFPTEWTAAPESVVVVYARVFEDGLTNLTAGNDVDPSLVGEVGVGADGSTPDDTWTWYEATANPGWVDDTEPGNDEYQADLVLPATEGDYDFAYRFTLDGGDTYVYCDGSVEGSDGAADGYQPDNAGQLSVVAAEDLCDPNPCTEVGPRVCEGDAVVQNTVPGVCTVEDGLPVCAYETEVIEDCSTGGDPCFGGFCRADGFPPVGEGHIVMVEIMLDTAADELASWFEVTNTTGDDLDLAGCVFTHEGEEWPVETTVAVGSDAYAVIGTTADAEVLGTSPQAVWADFVPADDEGTLSLSCYGTEIDSVTYVSADFDEGVSRQVGIENYDAERNDFWPAWCEGESSIGVPGSTPGAENRDCPVPTPEVENCWIQFPDEFTAAPDEEFTVYGQVIAPGITDATDATDVGPGLVAEFGAGGDGTVPSEDLSWSFLAAEPNTGFSSADGVDEYQFTGTPTLLGMDAGLNDYAFRFSTDEGDTWTYCDRIVGDSAGAADGYQTENAGSATVPAPSPCEPNPCTEPPAAPSCEGDEVVSYPTPGICTVEGDGFTCDYPEERTDCAAEGGTCDSGACADLPSASIDFCKIQFPTDFDIGAGASQTYYGRIYSEGITDRTPSTDPYGPLVFEWGIGSEGEDVEAWSWLSTEPNTGYVGSGFTAGEDEYQITYLHDVAGTFRFAFRASGDGGTTWTYCDISGANEDGSAAFDASDTGVVRVSD